MNDIDSLVFVLFLLLAAVIVAHAVYVGLRKPNRRVPTLQVNRRNLRRMGCLRGLAFWFAYFPLVILLAAVCWYGGRMDIRSALGTVAVLWFVPIIYLFQILRLKYPPLRRALACKEFDRELAGREFLFLQNAWQYADADWFIRVGRDHTAALCARWIDFEKPARFLARTEDIRANKGVYHINAPLLRFTGRDGSKIDSRLDCSPDIAKWVKLHGGKIKGIDA